MDQDSYYLGRTLDLVMHGDRAKESTGGFFAGSGGLCLDSNIVVIFPTTTMVKISIFKA